MLEPIINNGVVFFTHQLIHKIKFLLFVIQFNTCLANVSVTLFKCLTALQYCRDLQELTIFSDQCVRCNSKSDLSIVFQVSAKNSKFSK